VDSAEILQHQRSITDDGRLAEIKVGSLDAGFRRQHGIDWPGGLV
jgi:hypothetical protein